MTENIVTSDSINPKPAKKASATKSAPKAKKDVATSDVVSTEGLKYIYFSSGSAYVTADGYTFSREEPIHLIPTDEADHLLSLDNFRLPDQVELEEYLNKS